MIGLADEQEFHKTFFEWYIGQTNAQWVLEIGCAEGWCTRRLLAMPSVVHVDAVDVDPRMSQIQSQKLHVHAMTSNEFFGTNLRRYDLIFIDADHSESQVTLDTLNALNALQDDGLIALHDTYPPSARHAEADMCGTAWQAAFQMDSRRSDKGSIWSDYQVFTFPVTLGLTLIQRRGLPAWINEEIAALKGVATVAAKS